MKIDIVSFSNEEGATGLFIDGELHTYGDDYHDKIQVWCDAFIEGINYMCSQYIVEEPIVTRYELNEEGSERFANDGWECPQKWPSRKWSKYATISQA